jgi:hypothetical protein
MSAPFAALIDSLTALLPGLSGYISIRGTQTSKLLEIRNGLSALGIKNGNDTRAASFGNEIGFGFQFGRSDCVARTKLNSTIVIFSSTLTYNLGLLSIRARLHKERADQKQNAVANENLRRHEVDHQACHQKNRPNDVPAEMFHQLVLSRSAVPH